MLTKEQQSIISNRMRTVIELYDRNNTISDIAKKTGLYHAQVQKVLSKNNFYHGIERNEGTLNHPANPLVFYDDFKFLLDCNSLDYLRG